MDPFIGGALISSATSLVGGLFGRSSAKKDLAMQRQLINEQNEYNNPTNIRRRAEEAGFNPLSFIGPGVGLQTGVAQANSANYMGAAIADAGMAIADGMARKAELGKLDKLQQANAKLAAKVQSLTLRPKVAGVYAQRETTPTIAAAVGGKDAKADRQVSDVVSGNSPLAGAVVGPDDGNLTGVQLAVKKDVPAFRFFGHDFYGSGLFSSAQQVEDGIGESEIVSVLYAPLAITDAGLNEAFKFGGAVRGYTTRKKLASSGGFTSGGKAYAPMPDSHATKLKKTVGQNWYREQFP
jgi:hypothetical protein